jgi:hypothetical protein
MMMLSAATAVPQRCLVHRELKGTVVTNLDWGSLSSWVGTLITSTSALVAVFSYRRSVRDKEREQASRISAWITPEISTRLIKEAPGVYTQVFLLTVHVANQSEDPVYDVRVSGKWIGQPLTTDELPGSLAGTASVEFDRRHYDLSRSSADATFPTTFAASVEQPSIAFTDTLGRRWTRKPDRRLLRDHTPVV